MKTGQYRLTYRKSRSGRRSALSQHVSNVPTKDISPTSINDLVGARARIGSHCRWARPSPLWVVIFGCKGATSQCPLCPGDRRGRLRPKIRHRAVHSITSSARPSSESGTIRPRALATLRLITSSNLVGNCTGRSAGLAPFSIRSMYPAACRNKLAKSTP